jgi:site-specific DNA-cytosine methylase
VRVLELYAGIGGVAASGADVVAAIDHDVYAHTTYTANFDHPAHRINLVSIRADRLAAFDADLWWMSPPCQPFTVRGARRDVADRRCESFLALLEHVRTLRPRHLVVENVPGFAGSLAHARLRQALEGYAIREVSHCPSEDGRPVQRPRFFVLATTDTFSDAPAPGEPVTLDAFLDTEPPAHTWLDEAFLARFGDALHVVDRAGVAVCFTGAYGKSPVYAGSYLDDRGRLRRFSPAEIARLHGFGAGFVLPDDPRRAYKLLGNGLSVDSVRHVLAQLGRAGV